MAPEPAAAADLLESARRVLRETFGFEGFREGQEAVVGAVLAGRDVLCVMPTGAGKSLCYQLPALLKTGVTLVVSPLIALMKDQVESLRRRGIPAAEVNSSIPLEEQDERLDAAERGEVKLLYVAPERFRNERFRRRILKMGVALVAIDEAHCISQWGHDFRPDYRRIGPALDALGKPQVIALTATAPVEVQEDVVQQLSLREPLRYLEGLVRANLAYAVASCHDQAEKDRRVVEAVRRPGASIVYCATRKQVERVADLLSSRGLPALRYHAGLESEDRSRAQEAFLSGGAPCIVATNAFGMGVDRPDVRRVVHFEIPRAVEAYVQESGRAGRDGAPAECLLLFHEGDLHVQRFFIENSHPSREVVTEVLRVLLEAGEGRLELTTQEISERLRVEASSSAVGAALVVLDRAEVVRRGRRGENLARVTVLAAPDGLLGTAPLPPGLTRLLAALVESFGIGRAASLDVTDLADRRGITPETLRRGLQRLHDLGRIDYVPAFRGRATQIRAEGEAEEILALVDFEALAERRRREEAKLDQMVAYARARTCRRRVLLRCFGVPEAPPCSMCDRCGTPEVAAVSRATTRARDEALRQVLETVRAHDGRFGFQRLARHLAGSKAQNVSEGRLARGPTFGALAYLGVKGVEVWLRTAHEEGLLDLLPRTLDGGRRVHVVALSAEGRSRLAETGGAKGSTRGHP